MNKTLRVLAYSGAGAFLVWESIFGGYSTQLRTTGSAVPNAETGQIWELDYRPNVKRYVTKTEYVIVMLNFYFFAPLFILCGSVVAWDFSRMMKENR